MRFSTPTRITAEIRRLCRLIARGEPTFVPVVPRSDSAAGECFVDVLNQVRDHGGDIVHGWTIWEWPGIIVQGEFHAVWRDRAGELVDVSLKTDREKRILFLVDPKRTFCERRVDNIRLGVGNDPRIKELILIHERFYRATRDIPFGRSVDLGSEAVALRQRGAELELLLMRCRSARRAKASR